MKIHINITLDPIIIQIIDKKRGQISRARYMNDYLLDSLGVKR